MWEWLVIGVTALFSALKSLFVLALVIISISIFLEFVREKNWLHYVLYPFLPLGRLLKISENGLLSLIAGQLFGVVYGAGLIIQLCEEGMEKREIYVLNVFLSLSHAIIEDTLLFVALGVNGFLLLGSRTIIAMVASWVVFFFIRQRAERVNSTPAK